jgi:heme exporter protein A
VAVLQASNLSKFYGLRPILKGVSFEVNAGDFVAILGANGAGKTTLLRILCTLSRPNTGALRIDGVDALKQPDQARQRLGVVSHQTLVYPDLSAYENLRFFGDLHGLPGDSLAVQIEDTLRRVNLWTRAHDRVATFSRGMTQRLSIARAILHDPALLLLDEPFTGLDQPSAGALSALLRDVAVAGRSVIMTTHEFGRGLEGVTRALLIKGGTVAATRDGNINTQTLLEMTA